MTTSIPTTCITISVTDRPRSLLRLLQSIYQASQRSARAHLLSQQLYIIVVENSRYAQARTSNLETLNQMRQRGLQLLYVDDERYGRSIGQSRQAQQQALKTYLNNGTLKQPDIVWMLDDDLTLQRLIERDHKLQVVDDIDYLAWLEQQWIKCPAQSVIVGEVCGAPPIRPDAILSNQSLDLNATLAHANQLSPHQPYSLPPQGRPDATPDFYYDHSEQHQHLLQPYLLRAGDVGTAREHILNYVKKLPQLFDGQTLTRQLLDSAVPQLDTLEATQTPLRGGNTIFLGLSSFFAHTYPELKLDVELTSRRADMVGATLLAKRGQAQLFKAPLRLYHERTADPPYAPICWTSWRRGLRGELTGAALARAVMHSLDAPQAFITGRIERMTESLSSLYQERNLLQQQLHRRSGWVFEDLHIRSALEDFVEKLSQCLQQVYMIEQSAPSHIQAKLMEFFDPPRLIAQVVEYAAFLCSEGPYSAHVELMRSQLR